MPETKNVIDENSRHRWRAWMQDTHIAVSDGWAWRRHQPGRMVRFLPGGVSKPEVPPRHKPGEGGHERR